MLIYIKRWLKLKSVEPNLTPHKQNLMKVYPEDSAGPLHNVISSRPLSNIIWLIQLLFFLCSRKGGSELVVNTEVHQSFIFEYSEPKQILQIFSCTFVTAYLYSVSTCRKMDGKTVLQWTGVSSNVFSGLCGSLYLVFSVWR